MEGLSLPLYRYHSHVMDLFCLVLSGSHFLHGGILYSILLSCKL